MFILSGSQKLELMKGMSESLAGRVSISELTGLSMREIYGVKFNRHFIPTDAYIKEREKHAGFIINKGNATSKDVEELIKYIKQKVYEKFGKEIETEIEIIH